MRTHAGWFNEEGSHQDHRLDEGKGEINQLRQILSVLVICNRPLSLEWGIEPPPHIVSPYHQADVIWLKVKNIGLPPGQQVAGRVAADALVHAANPELRLEGLQHGVYLQNVARSQSAKEAFPDWPGTTRIRDGVSDKDDLAA